MLKEDGGTKWEIGIKSIPFSTITGFKTLRRSFSLRIPSLFVSYISNMRLSQSLSQASFNLKEECYFGISELDQPARVKTCQNILQILRKKMIPSDNLQVLYKTEIIILGKNLQYLHQQQQQQFAYVAIIPNKKMQKSCPEQHFASFGKEVILQKTHPQQKI